MTKYTILICDDEKEIVDLLKIYLKNDFDLLEAYDGEEALEILQNEKVDLALVDIMMPKLSGLDLIKLVKEDLNIPILIISAKTSLGERLLGYEIGADDYITKPFEPLEVLAKVKARLKADSSEAKFLKADNITLNLHECTLQVGCEVFDLTKVEFLLTKLFMENPNRVFTKAQLYKYGWEEDYYGDDNSI